MQLYFDFHEVEEPYQVKIHCGILQDHAYKQWKKLNMDLYKMYKQTQDPKLEEDSMDLYKMYEQTQDPKLEEDSHHMARKVCKF